MKLNASDFSNITKNENDLFLLLSNTFLSISADACGVSPNAVCFRSHQCSRSYFFFRFSESTLFSNVTENSTEKTVVILKILKKKTVVEKTVENFKSKTVEF